VLQKVRARVPRAPGFGWGIIGSRGWFGYAEDNETVEHLGKALLLQFSAILPWS